MRNKLFSLGSLIFPFFFLYLLPAKNQFQPKIPVIGYILRWNDEFDGNKLDEKKWNYRGLGKRDDAYISSRAIKLDGKGHLIINTFIQNDSVFTGMISTENIFETKYGYFESRIKFNNVSGSFSSFWLQSHEINEPNSTPEKNGAEIDIFEYCPHSFKDQVSHALHWGGYGKDHKVEGPVWAKLKKTEDDFHIIGLEWTKDSYTTYVDGEKTYSGNKLVSQVRQFMILSLLVNQQSAGPLDKTALPNEFTVDYIRVYKKTVED